MVEWHVVQGLSNPDGIGRRDAYATYGTPTAWFDGQDYVVGPTNAYSNYRARLDQHLAVDSPITVAASADFGPSAVDVTISVALEAGQSLPDDVSQYSVRVIVYEEDVTYCCDTLGGDAFHGIGRALSPGQPLTFARGLRASVVETVPIDPAWGADLAVVAFVEHVSGAIVTSSGAEPSAIAATSWGRLKALHR